jgi:hypothetical protein
LYRFGVFGTTLFLVFWGRAIFYAARFSKLRLGQWYRIGALASLTVLSSLTVSNLTSNAFFHMDSLFMFGLMTGIVAGIRQHWTQRSPEERH